MSGVAGFFQDIGSLISTIGFADIVDILIVTYLIYMVIDLIRKTSSYSLAKGLFILLIALWLSGIFHLTMINYILRKAVEIGLIALVILFQPELRKLLAKMGSRKFYGFFPSKEQDSTEIEDNAGFDSPCLTSNSLINHLVNIFNFSKIFNSMTPRQIMVFTRF